MSRQTAKNGSNRPINHSPIVLAILRDNNFTSFTATPENDPFQRDGMIIPVVDVMVRRERAIVQPHVFAGAEKLVDQPGHERREICVDEHVVFVVVIVVVLGPSHIADDDDDVVVVVSVAVTDTVSWNLTFLFLNLSLCCGSWSWFSTAT